MFANFVDPYHIRLHGNELPEIEGGDKEGNKEGFSYSGNDDNIYGGEKALDIPYIFV